MELDRSPAHRVLRLSRAGPERGSAIVEGLIGIGLAFLLLALVVQAAFVVVARNAAEAAVAASARRAARPAADLAGEEAALAAVMAATVPGAREVSVAVTRHDGSGHAEASFEWDPPGPDWLPIRMRVQAAVPVNAPP